MVIVFTWNLQDKFICIGSVQYHACDELQGNTTVNCDAFAVVEGFGCEDKHPALSVILAIDLSDLVELFQWFVKNSLELLHAANYLATLQEPLAHLERALQLAARERWAAWLVSLTSAYSLVRF